MKKFGKWVVILATLVLSGCAGNLVQKAERVDLGVKKYNPETKKVEDWNLSFVPKKWPKWVDSSIYFAYLARADIDSRELANVSEAERVCPEYARQTNPSLLASVSANSLLYGGAGGIGLGAGALAMTGASVFGLTVIGLTTGVMAGATNAITGWDLTWAAERCASVIMRSPNLIPITSPQ